MTTTDLSRPNHSAQARRAMVDSQLRTSGVNEPWVLAAMGALPREDFVPESARDAAYTDRAVPLGNGRFLAAPLVQGKILDESATEVTDAALLISGGSDYLAALLKPLVGSLRIVDAGDLATTDLSGPYSLIIVDGAAEELPEALAQALAPEGRLITGRVEGGITRLAVGRHSLDGLVFLPLADLGIPVLADLAAPRRWTF